MTLNFEVGDDPKSRGARDIEFWGGRWSPNGQIKRSLRHTVSLCTLEIHTQVPPTERNCTNHVVWFFLHVWTNLLSFISAFSNMGRPPKKPRGIGSKKSCKLDCYHLFIWLFRTVRTAEINANIFFCLKLM